MKINQIIFYRFYILPITLIGLAVILGEVFVQNTLKKQSQDSHIINISGRQRMLSQKMVKLVLLMKNSKDFAEFHQLQKELKTIFILWEESHQKLANDNNTINSQHLPINSLSIQQMFAQLQPYEESIENAVQNIVWIQWKDRYTIDVPLAQILESEKFFLNKMNEITFQYDQESKQKIENVKVLVFWIAVMIVFLLIILVLFFFKPTSKKIKLHLNIIETNNRELEKSNQLFISMQIEQAQLIRELKATQEELLQNNDAMKTIQNKLETQQIIFKMSENIAKIASYEYDLVQQKLKYSENLPKLYGLDKNTTIDIDTFNRLGHPDDSINIDKELNLALVNNQRMIEKTYRAKNCKKNTWHYYKFLGKIIFDREEEPIKVLGSVQDITQNIESQLNLKKSKVRLEVSEKAIKKSFEKQKQYEAKIQKALIQNKAINKALDNSALVSIANLEGEIMKVNQIFCQVSGYTQEELLGKPHNIINSGYHSKEFWQAMWKTISRGNTWRAEVCNRAKNGELYWVDTVINPIKNENGKTYQYLSINVSFGFNYLIFSILP